MPKCLSLFKNVRCDLLVLGLLSPLSLLAGCGSTDVRAFSSYSEYAVAPADSHDASDVKWADYFKRHWQKRAVDKDCVLNGTSRDESQLQVSVDVDPVMKESFSFTRNERGVTLKARNAEAMLWLQYQFMAAASAEDARFAGEDLPAALLSCRRDTAGTFAFEYRGIYSPANADADLMPILGTHHVDFDWGLWGHNLRKIFPEGIPQGARALVGGHRSDRQFCFSSEATFKAYEAYVIDQYGPGEPGSPVRFAVMPNDNGEVCLCEACRAAGNTPTSATPAVTRLVERLAKRFPAQLFFTSAYATTLAAPDHALPGNVGVLVSALSLPLKAGVAKGGQQNAAFERTVETWKHATPRIYVWDYMRNFDDYFTPYPCLRLLQERLQYYQSLGVRGLFFNGSGYDYASFDDVQTAVLAQLMINPQTDVNAAVRKYFLKHYPVTADLLSDFCATAEAKAYASGLQPYAGITEAADSYLSQQAVETFWTKLDAKSKEAGEAERQRLNPLLAALNLTRLELVRLQPSQPEGGRVERMLHLLADGLSQKSMANYREAHGETRQYLLQWQQSFPWLSAKHNHLEGKTIKSLSKPDKGQADLKLLTDGKQGFTTDYHTQWVIQSSPEWQLQLPALSQAAQPLQISLSFLHAPWWHIYAPASVEAWQEGKMLIRVSVPVAVNGRSVVTLTLPAADASRSVDLRIKQAQKSGRVTMACDEIVEGAVPRSWLRH